MDPTFIALALPWLPVAFGCWLGYQLVRQNGRILLHLEQLEQQLAQAAAASARPFRPLDVAPVAPAGLPAGEPAPAFELPGLDGARHRLADFLGKKVLMIFFNPSCGFCAQMAPDLAALPVDDEEGRPVPLLITTGDLDRNRQLVEEHALRGPVLIDADHEVGPRYEARGTPVGYLVDERGRIASPLAIGARALLDLAEGRVPAADQPAGDNGHREHHGNRSLADSKIQRGGLAAGTAAPDFRLPRLEGGELSLAEFRGRQVLLVFSDPHCGPCDWLMPRLQEAWGAGARTHALQPALAPAVLLVSRGEPGENAEKVRKHGLTFPVVLQKKWEVSKLYAMFATPVAYLVDEEGVIAAEVAQGAPAILELLERAGASEPRPPGGGDEARDPAPGGNGRRPGRRRRAGAAAGG